MSEAVTKRFVRPKKGRILGGVCLAIAHYFNIDVTWVRLFWIFLLIPGGLPGLIPYLILWLAIPSEN
jgi:phage shock protein C